MSKRVGIEKINIYGASMCLSQSDLAVARGKDPEVVLKDYLIETRSLNPPYEDTITMAYNAAAPMLTEEDKEQIGMVIFGTEGSVDFGKPNSTEIIGHLGLNERNIRNFETKFACYSGVAALDVAINWIYSGLNHGKKALVVASDFSRKHFGKDHEFVMGGVGTALLISDTPKVIEFEPFKKGTWTTNIYDTFRPSARAEVGNNETSLYSYMDSLEGAYKNYVENAGEEVDFDTYFSKNLYHTPFPGMAFQAHRVLCNLQRPRKKSEIRESFNEKTLPALVYPRLIGSNYGSSNFVGTTSIIDHSDVKPGDRIGYYAYGSGAIGEYYSGIVLPEAKKIVGSMNIEAKLKERKLVTIEEYEMVENTRETYIENPNFKTDFSILDNWYQKHYAGTGKLVLKGVDNWYRTYEKA